MHILTRRTQKARLERLYAKLEALPPHSIDMHGWAKNCGTVACIAGHCMLGLRGYRAELKHTIIGPRLVLLHHGVAVDWETAATQYLGLSEDQAGTLFWVSGWPDTFRDRFYDNPSPEAQKGIVLARLRHFITTGK